MKNLDDKLSAISDARLVTVTGGFGPLIPVAIGGAIAVGMGIWSAGHSKGLQNRSKKKCR